MSSAPAAIALEGEKWLRIHRQGLLKGADLVLALGNKWYRLNTLYKIKDKDGQVRTFRPNKQQRQRFIRGHCRNVILKARQLGFTTFEMIDALDDCLFTQNFSAGCIAHALEDAKDIFRNKIKFAYDQLRQSAWMTIFQAIGLKLPAPTSYRGGTLQRLHVSEFGKICRKYPDKAQEIVTGAFEAVGLGNKVTLESTAEGREGYFHDYCDTAQKLSDAGKQPTLMDFQFHFFPWWDEPGYRLEPRDVLVPSWLHDYFAELEAKHQIKTDAAQQAWYAKKAEVLKDDMKREYPSTPDEAFAQSVDGAYFMQQMRWLRKNGRITTKAAYNPSLPVITAWDLGMSDAMSIVFCQVLGREVRIIDYLEHSGEGLEFYAKELAKKGYTYGAHYGPHDLAVRELGTGKARIDTAAQFGIRFEIVPRISNHAEGIKAVRQFLPMCWFTEQVSSDAADEDKRVGVDRLVDCLDNYRKDWDERLGVYRSTPRHDWASHGAKAFETLARSGLFELSTGINSTPSAPNTERGRRTWNAHT
ncbi:terminase [Pseudomonas anguilliseptica]|uniref:terminase n=1 Tax=Pseudomonas anguilliseptica TaxID=53406 RepID=UPI00325BD6A6